MIPAYLSQRGCKDVADIRNGNGQTLLFTVPGGAAVIARVKLCWRRDADGRNQDAQTSYSAAQLMARVRNGDWIGSIQEKMDRLAQEGHTHLMLVQRDGPALSKVALVPISSVSAIWTKQRDVSASLVDAGKLGRRKKNHAMNGHSPTLWLQDDNGGALVAKALWEHPGVVDLSALPPTSGWTLPEEVADPKKYVEGACETVSVNAYERDQGARTACIKHFGPTCAVCGFSFGRTYGPAAEGHIHVHHLKPIAKAGGAYVVNPRTDLRPVCANCHSVIHLGNACRSIEEVQVMIAAARESNEPLHLTARPAS